MTAQHQCELSLRPDHALPKLQQDASRWTFWSRKLRAWCSISNGNPECQRHITSMASFALERRRQAKLPQWWIVHPFSRARKLRAWCSISNGNHECQRRITSMASFALERRRQAELPQWWIVHPFSRVRFIWDMVMLVILTTALFTIPFMICYVVFDHETIRTDSVNVFIYAFCWLDIMMNCISGIYSEKNRTVILEQKEILRSYAKGYLLLDVLTSLPYDHITRKWRFLPGPDGSMVIVLVNLIPILKVIHYITLNSYSLRMFRYLQLEDLSHQLFSTMILSIYLFHWFSCLCYILPLLIMYGYHLKLKECEDCWVSEIYSMNVAGRYQQSLLIAVNNLTANSFGIYPPKKEGHLLVCTFLMVVVMILHIKAIMQASGTKFEEIMTQLAAFMRHKQLPAYMKRRLVAYYHYRFMKSYFREKLILSTLSEHLRAEIVLHSCGRLLENVAIFKNLPQNVLGLIMASLKPELYLPNDVIVKASTRGDCMFFLASGTVAVLTPTGKEVCHLEDGAHFGEVALLVQDQRRVASVVAIEMCEAYRLDRKDFRRCIAVHSELYAKIERIAIDRMEKTVMLEEQYKRFLQHRSSRGSNNVKQASERFRK